MADIASKIAAGHEWWPVNRCTCGQWTPREGAGPDDFIEHVAEATERAVRARIAADIRATFTDPERLRPRDPEGEFATDFLNDWRWAAHIAEGGTQ